MGRQNAVRNMAQLLQEKNLFLEQFAEFEKAQRDPPWLRRIRNAGIARFAELDLPTTRHEDWRFTNLAPMAKMTFQLGNASVASTKLSPYVRGLENCHPLVFVNGRFNRTL